MLIIVLGYDSSIFAKKLKNLLDITKTNGLNIVNYTGFST